MQTAETERERNVIYFKVDWGMIGFSEALGS
jgi:hypothetical protein